MLYALLGTAAVLFSFVGALVAHRHLAAAAWDRELQVAFAVAERREMPTRRVL
jgi:hypothetical protein